MERRKKVLTPSSSSIFICGYTLLISPHRFAGGSSEFCDRDRRHAKLKCGDIRSGRLKSVVIKENLGLTLGRHRGSFLLVIVARLLIASHVLMTACHVVRSPSHRLPKHRWPSHQLPKHRPPKLLGLLGHLPIKHLINPRVPSEFSQHIRYTPRMYSVLFDQLFWIRFWIPDDCLTQLAQCDDSCKLKCPLLR